ncbi:MAG: glycoside hydrolase family 92 protein [Crocinitomicaceae bacterium]|nr:glycoside hydrolase family 92 protein [Crocinitomicaceae bacterium]
MRIILLFSLLLISSITSICIAQIPEIQKASDKARGLIGDRSIPIFSPSVYVNPFIGTGGHGHTFPGATAPFGMMQLSPDTRYEGWDGCSGYHYSDSIIYGFSHTHLSGTGVPDYCDLLVVPQIAKAKVIPGYLSKEGYGSKFSHSKEKASPGYYEVYLEDSKVNVRLTTTERAGIHEYTFDNTSDKKFILLDLDHRDKVLAAAFKILSKNEISGTRISKDWANEQHFYFHLNTSIPFKKAKLIKKNGMHKLLLEFPKTSKVITLKVGMSAVDEKGAKNNLEKEIGSMTFDNVRAQTVRNWNKELSKVIISTENQEQKTIFYSALYHSFVAPNLFSDSDGRFRGRDNQIHVLDSDQQQYTVFSLWDTYRGLNPLFTIIQQEKTNQFITTFLRQYKEGKDLPVWELAANETECMIGYHSVSVIADAYLKGIRNFDEKEALAAMVATSNFDEYGKKYFRENGFISAHEEPESVSKTLEYAYDDFCIAEMAKVLGNDSVYKAYTNSSYNFVNLFDPSTKFMRAKRGAQWYGPFVPTEVNFNYTEANSWQYSLYAPQHIDVLSNLLGGRDSLETWLDRLFSSDSKLSGRSQSDITGLIGQYAHGNEPSHHLAYLYNFTNAPFKTQFYVDRILKEMYDNAADGLSGNEDCGQMSAWYVLSSMGFYPTAPGSTLYQIGRPIFSDVSMNLENGKSLHIVSKNNSSTNKYVQSVSWNGKPLEKMEIDHLQLMEGGTLLFEMGNEATKQLENTNFYPEIIPDDFVPSPFVTNDVRIFDDIIKVGIDYNKINSSDFYTVYYCFDSINWMVYERPILIMKSAKLFTKLQRITKSNKEYFSPVVSCDFIKRDPSIHLELQTKYANQYAASGPNSLIDGIRGGKEFRTGDWQGFYGEDVKATIKFDQARTLSEIGISCIRDQKSWIFLPAGVEIEISTDGVLFESMPSIVIEKPTPSDVNPMTFQFIQKFEPKSVKAIRYKIKNAGVCPDWHLGKGNNTWLFVDELLFK